MSSSSAAHKKDEKSSGVISKAIAKITGPKTPKPLFQVGDRVQDKKTREPYSQEYRISQSSFSEFHNGRWQYKRHCYKWDLSTKKPEIINESDWIEEYELKKNTTPGPYSSLKRSDD